MFQFIFFEFYFIFFLFCLFSLSLPFSVFSRGVEIIYRRLGSKYPRCNQLAIGNIYTRKKKGKRREKKIDRNSEIGKDAQILIKLRGNTVPQKE